MHILHAEGMDTAIAKKLYHEKIISVNYGENWSANYGKH